MEFEWDDGKADSNWHKHGIRFERAAEVFADPLQMTIDDPFAIGEARLLTMGLVRGLGLLVVVHTSVDEGGEGERVRIISARRATSRERKVYEDG